jgi:site-specific DNA-methyltransferase (adenine-specific)
VHQTSSRTIRYSLPNAADQLTIPHPAFTTKRGALFAADCVELLFHLGDESIDTVFADPPFNLGKDYGEGFSDRFSKTEYLEWCRLWIDECARVLKPGGAFFLYAMPEHAYKFANFMERTLTFRHWIALTMKGTFPRGKRLYPAHYALLYFTKGQPKTFNRVRLPISVCRHCGKDIKDYGGHRKYLNPAGLNLTDFWEDTSPNRHRKSKFRAGINELKLMIPERAVLISTNPGEIVFDPFGGGGTTYQAAEKHDRLWLGCEISTATAIADRMAKSFPESFARETRLPIGGLVGSSRVSLRLLEGG